MATERTTINPEGVPAPIGAYSAVVQANCGRVAFLAGQVALNADGELVGAGDVAAQTKQVFHNLGKALEGIGASFSDVLEFTSYLVGRSSVQPFIQARSEIFPSMYPQRRLPRQHPAGHRGAGAGGPAGGGEGGRRPSVTGCELGAAECLPFLQHRTYVVVP